MTELKLLSRSLASNERYLHEETDKEFEVEQMFYIVADNANIKRDLIFERTRKECVIIARHISIVFLRDVWGFTYKAIGKMLGLDHSTAIHAYKSHDGRYKYDAEYAKIYDKSKIWVC